LKSDECGESCGEEVEKGPKALNLLDKMVESAAVKTQQHMVVKHAARMELIDRAMFLRVSIIRDTKMDLEQRRLRSNLEQKAWRSDT
jgi:hypothetical protein